MEHYDPWECSKAPSFEEFLLEIPTSERSQNDTLTATDAVKILRRVFDPVNPSETTQRPMLIGVDEISKSKNDKVVMKQLGAVLDKFKDVDVIVSALSPAYVENLVTDSQRPVDYVVLSPLLAVTFKNVTFFDDSDSLLQNGWNSSSSLV